MWFYDKTELHPNGIRRSEVIKATSLISNFIEHRIHDVIRPGVLFSTNLIDGFNKYERKGYIRFLKYDEIQKVAKREGASMSVLRN